MISGSDLFDDEIPEPSQIMKEKVKITDDTGSFKIMKLESINNIKFRELKKIKVETAKGLKLEIEKNVMINIAPDSVKNEKEFEISLAYMKKDTIEFENSSLLGLIQVDTSVKKFEKPVKIHFEKLSKDQINNNYIAEFKEGKNEFKSDEDCFIEKDLSKSALIFNVFHFCVRRFEELPLNILIDDASFNHEFDMKYDNLTDKGTQYKRGNLPYYVPWKFQRFALNIENFDEKYKNWAVAYHCTRSVSKDILMDFITHSLLLPDDITSSNRKITILDGHIERNAHPINVKSFKGDWASAIFCSPSIEYASFYSLNPNSKPTPNGKYPILVFQCRVEPSSMEIHPQTLGDNTTYPKVCPYYNNDELEWRILEKSMVKIYGILYLELDVDPSTEWTKKYKNQHFILPH